MCAMGCADAGMPASPQSQTHACVLNKKRVPRFVSCTRVDARSGSSGTPHAPRP
jgi:hypothetical protein